MQQYNEWIVGGLALTIVIFLFGMLIRKIFEIPEKYRNKSDCDLKHEQLERQNTAFGVEIRQDINRISSDINRMDEKLGKKIDRVHDRVDGILTKSDNN